MYFSLAVVHPPEWSEERENITFNDSLVKGKCIQSRKHGHFSSAGMSMSDMCRTRAHPGHAWQKWCSAYFFIFYFLDTLGHAGDMLAILVGEKY